LIDWLKAETKPKNELLFEVRNDETYIAYEYGELFKEEPLVKIERFENN
jgi:hypothetical protein